MVVYFFLINCVQFRNTFHIHYSWTFSYNGKYSEHFTIFHNDVFKFIFHSILLCTSVFVNINHQLKQSLQNVIISVEKKNNGGNKVIIKDRKKI